METYISMLRGINVSGQKSIKMDALNMMYETLAFQQIKTYIQSGNVIFKTISTPCKDLAATISAKILTDFGFDVPVIVLNTNELTDILNNNPYLMNGRNEDISRLYVTFLAQEPDNNLVEKIKTLEYDTDEFTIYNKTVYLFCPKNGYGNSKLSNNFFESKLQVTATTRNWKTVNELLKIAISI